MLQCIIYYDTEVQLKSYAEQVAEDVFYNVCKLCTNMCNQ